jgi:hypothetical protein
MHRKCFVKYYQEKVASDSVVAIATHNGLHGQRIDSRFGKRFYATVQTGSGCYPASYAMGTLFLFPVV